jgi:hypothetical protein
MRITKRHRWAGAGLALAATLALSACGTPPWTEPGADGSTPTPTPKPTAAEITTVVNELANGSTQHLLSAGDITLTVDYFSTLSMDEWKADANKPLSISMTANLGHDDGQRVYLSQMNVLVAVYGPDGALTSPAALADRATVNPGYLVKAPYSYSQTFVLPPVESGATYVTLSITYELLLQTTPTSSEYAKQTASDTLTVAIAAD